MNMKKTYKNKLPKGMEVESTKVRIENGEIFVDVELKERFEPKDGDFVVLGYETGSGSCYWISIIKDFKKEFDTILTVDYVNYTFKADGNQKEFLNKIEFDKKTDASEKVRPATPEEKFAFLDRLEKECHKRWNPETKKLEDIRWRAEEGCQYWFVSTISADTSIKLECNAPFDDERYDSGNYFRTQEAAVKIANQIKDIFKNSKVE